MTRVINGKSRVLGARPALPAGERRRSAARPTTPRWPGRRCTRSARRKVFAGQRADAFHVDLGSVFDLGALRPFNEAHLISMPAMGGVNAVQSFNVHTIALQVPARELTKDGRPPSGVLKPQVDDRRLGHREPGQDGPRLRPEAGQVRRSRSVGRRFRPANPLFNEVIVPMGPEGPVEHAGTQP